MFFFVTVHESSPLKENPFSGQIVILNDVHPLQYIKMIIFVGKFPGM